MSERAQVDPGRSRRSVLTAAVGAAAGVAVAMAAPAAVLADDPNDVVKSQDNATTAVTSITQGTADTAAFQANGNGAGAGVVGTTDATKTAGVVGLAGDAAQSSYGLASDLDAGVYGFADQTAVSAGVFAEGTTGVYALGDVGVYADGGSLGLFASAYPYGTALHAHAGTGVPPTPPTNTALVGTVTSTNQAGLLVGGRVLLPNRSGRTTFSAGQAAKAVTVSGMTSSNYAFAVLNASRSGVYVRAVVPAAGKITIYLSKAPTASTSVAWLVLG